MRCFDCGEVIGLRGTNREIFALGDSRRWLLGSSPRCDVVIRDPYVSPIHCVLERCADGAIIVRDGGSRNGTVVDERPVAVAQLLPGSYLTIGRTTLVAIGGPARAASAGIDALRRRDAVFRRSIERATATDDHVLIAGEPGTGKRLLARFVHEASNLRGPLVTMRCAAVPRSLAASELFGGDSAEVPIGSLGEARGGTLVLDEVGELPVDVQQRLARALQTDRHADVRIVATTSVDASRMQELRDRFAWPELSLPPLRARTADIPLLVESMLAEHGRAVSVDAWREITTYSWPSNLRELHAAVERAVELGADVLESRDFFPGAPRDREIVDATRRSRREMRLWRA